MTGRFWSTAWKTITASCSNYAAQGRANHAGPSTTGRGPMFTPAPMVPGSFSGSGTTGAYCCEPPIGPPGHPCRPRSRAAGFSRHFARTGAASPSASARRSFSCVRPTVPSSPICNRRRAGRTSLASPSLLTARSWPSGGRTASLRFGTFARCVANWRRGGWIGRAGRPSQAHPGPNVDLTVSSARPNTPLSRGRCPAKAKAA